MRATHLIPCLALAACVRTVGVGPDLGACGDYPEGAYTWGQIGIGTCLAGPSDLQFLVRDGTTWLMVANADPFRNFDSGSLLLLDTAGIGLNDDLIGAHELRSGVLPMDRFLGGVAIDIDDTAIIPSRLSADSFTLDGLDRAWLVDLSNPADPRLRVDRPFVSVRQDPFDVAVFDRKAWVLNPTDSSLSVIDLTANPPSLLDPAPTTDVTDRSFLDVDGSGSFAEAVVEPLTGENLLTTDVWSATWIEGTTRAWIPTPAGFERWSTGGASWSPSGYGVELDVADYPTLDGSVDPWITYSGDALAMHLSIGGSIRRAFTDTSDAGWVLDSFVALSPSGWFSAAAGPAAVQISGSVALFFDGVTDDGTTAIGIAETGDGVVYVSADAPLMSAPAPFESLAQPTLLLDPHTDTVRMWMSMWDGTSWSVGLSESANGFTGWSAPQQVLAVPGGDAGAPVVTWSGGRYQMYLSQSVGGAWEHALATSIDGVTWSTPAPWLTSTLTDARPPRAGVQQIATNAWRLEGYQTGLVEGAINEGIERQDTTHNLSLRFASGHEVGTALKSAGAELGVEPGSLADVFVPTLYVTATDALGVDHLAALRSLGESWALTAWDLIPNGAGGNVSGASSPVVYADGDAWRMIYAAADANGATSLRAATSVDGIDWVPDASALLSARADWDSSGQLPHAVVRDGDTLTLWMSGFDGSRWSIGRATAGADGVWSREESPAMEAGPPGTFDDAGVRDPMPDTCTGLGGLWYSAFDGAGWTIGYATFDGDEWVRRTSPFTGDPAAALGPIPSSFANFGVRNPLLDASGGACELLFAGTDGPAWRTGRALAQGSNLFPATRYATAGDQLGFNTTRGETGTSEIELTAVIDGAGVLTTGGEGPIAMTVDEARGLMFVVAPNYPGVIVVDIVDDSSAGFVDRNFMGIETVLRFSSPFGLLGPRDLLLTPDGRLYLAVREPDSIYVVDTSGIVDDDRAEISDFEVLGALPMHDLTDDAGQPTEALISTSALAWVPGQNLLIATHFRDNSVSVFDLRRGAWGEEVAYIPNVGENPSTIEVSPDGAYAAIGCYLGEVTDEATNSSIALLDLRPASPTWLQVTTRIVNR
jgi:hypothetical protein